MPELKQCVHFIDGYKNAILADCSCGDLYRMDEDAKLSMSRFLNGESGDYSFIDSFLKRHDLIESRDTTKPSYPKDNKLLTVWFELTKKCNLHCIHCYNQSAPCIENSSHSLSLKDWKRICDQLVEYTPRSIVLIGGEPLLFEDTDSLICYIHKRMPATSIVLYSNLTVLQDSLIKTLADNNVKVVTSVYSDNAIIHNRITKNNQSFDLTITAIKRLIDSGISVRANIVVTSENEKTITSTSDYLFNLTSARSRIDVIRCVRDDLASIAPKESEHKRYIESEKNLLPITEYYYVRGKSGNQCWQGKMNISCDGTVSPCIMFQGRIKKLDLHKSRLNEIIESKEFLQFTKHSKDNIDVCCDCEYRYFCPDCRPRARSMNKREGNCLYNPYLGKWNVDKILLSMYTSSYKVDAKMNNSKVAFVFSCPGKTEKEENRLCAGHTGDNLDELIKYLHAIKPELFLSDNRENYYITNASNCVHYQKLTGDSEPLNKEIQIPENLFRLKNELSNRQIIVCFGKKASYAIDLLKLNGIISKTVHIGTKGLNSFSVKGINDNTKKLSYIADQIICDISKSMRQ